MVRLIEDISSNISIGDIVLLKNHSKSPFNTSHANYLVNTNHMFLVLSKYDDKLFVCPISSNMKMVDKFGSDRKLPLDISGTNLRKPSFASCDVNGEVPIDSIHKIVGHISRQDYVKAIKIAVSVSPETVLEKYLINDC